MKKVITLLVCLSIGASALSGCSPGNNESGATIVGAAAGGLVANKLFGRGSGKVFATMAGAALGAYIGNQYGRYMDRQDRANMQRAITTTPVGRQASWTNPNTDAGPVTYNVRPVRNYRKEGHYCREYQTRITVGGKVKTAYGKACRQPDGDWKIVN